ncbi:MAG: transcription termination factor Rho [Desulfobacteraceae bacterium]|nr:transcription termination factor Rho [Desulfobacteraceae bacterium]
MQQVIGFLELNDRGFGFLRNIDNNFQSSPQDTFVPVGLIKRFNLREGVMIDGYGVPGDKRNSNYRLADITRISNLSVEDYLNMVPFRDRVSIDPFEKYSMIQGPDDVTGKALDLIVPVGKGQRGLIISPPKSGKTTILKHMADSIVKNHPEAVVFVLLVDERPEEVTAFRRELSDAIVLSSSSDQGISSHLRMARLTINSAIRCAEAGNDVVVLIDSLTRMARAFNSGTDSGGKTMSGGVGAKALATPRAYFGAARNLEGGGSLTNIATILKDTGSRMDDVIFQEFKGTGNMDLVLSRKCSENRVWPAINIRESGTRKEELIHDEEELKQINEIRRSISSLDEKDAMEQFLSFI